jgi:hypothetical protein
VTDFFGFSNYFEFNCVVYRLNTNPIKERKETWLERQRKDGTWADQYSVIAASNRYNIRIVTYQWEKTKQGLGVLSRTPIVTLPFRNSLKNKDDKLPTLYVLNLKDLHFSLLEKIA